MKEIYNETLRVLMYDKGSRTNDLRLYKLVLKNLNLPTDLNELEELGSNILETISRTRRKIQVENPMLYEERTRRNRKKREELFREYAHE